MAFEPASLRPAVITVKVKSIENAAIIIKALFKHIDKWESLDFDPSLELTELIKDL